ncbi:MAG: sulfatase [Saprospiraceae bacterium]|nr:MAG: sulfatase [Saprospiraceae bacterium]
MNSRILALGLFLASWGFLLAQSKPNILVILVDDLGYHDLSCNGSVIYQTPNIDSLAAQSLQFEQAYSNYPRCVPSRYSFLTGTYPIINGEVPDDGFEMNMVPENRNFVQQFNKAGYQTAFFGKWHLGDGASSPSSFGFDISVAAGKAGSPISYHYPFNKPKGNNKNVKKAPIEGLDEKCKEGDYLTDVLTDEVLNFIAADHQDQPFMAVLSFYAVHQPLEAKYPDIKRNKEEISKHDFGDRPEYVKEGTGRTKMRQDNANYAAMVETMDQNVGRLLTQLKKQGIADNTIIIFTSDHGGLSNDGYNQRQLATSNYPFRAGKGWLYEGGIRVPLFVYHPSTVVAGRESQSIVLLMDVFPTLLDWVIKKPVAPEIDGQSFLKVIQHTEKWADRTVFWHESKARPRNTGESPASAIRSGPWKLIHFYEQNIIELYRPAIDISEENNLLDQFPQESKHLLKLLNTWKASF